MKPQRKGGHSLTKVRYMTPPTLVWARPKANASYNPHNSCAYSSVC
jgi:hypothetical protein